MKTIYYTVLALLAGFIFFSATYEDKAEIEFVSAILGGCNEEAVLRSDNQFDKDTIVISTISDNINVFVGHNYICGAPFETECEIENDSILMYIIDTCEEPFSCYERCYCYYTFDFKFVRQSDKNYPYKILLLDPRKNEPKIISEGIIPKVQDVARFIGTFNITGECADLNSENNIFDEERDVMLSAGSESDLLLNMSSFSGNYLQVFIHNDSLFIPLQSFENFDGTQAFFSGEGKTINDSIFLHYRAGGSFGAFECSGKGKKMAPAITQAEFAPTGAEWHYTYTSGCCPEKHFNHIISEKDTMVEKNSCRALRQYYDNSNVANATYIIKQEQGKIYYYYQNRFNLLLDFDAKVNDTVEFTFAYKKYDDFPLPSCKDTILSVRYLVEEITINAQNIKTFTAKGVDEFYYGDGVYRPPYTYVYTEKIGLHGEFMPIFDNAAHPDGEVFRQLRCYSDADFSFMSDEWSAMSLPCYYSIATGIDIPQNDSTATSIDILQDENIKIYPNPFNHNLFVFTSNGGSIEIVDVSGKAIYDSELSNEINEISTGHFFTGVYFVKIRNKDNRIKTIKIIKS